MHAGACTPTNGDLATRLVPATLLRFYLLSPFRFLLPARSAAASTSGPPSRRGRASVANVGTFAGWSSATHAALRCARTCCTTRRRTSRAGRVAPPAPTPPPPPSRPCPLPSLRLRGTGRSTSGWPSGTSLGTRRRPPASLPTRSTPPLPHLPLARTGTTTSARPPIPRACSLVVGGRGAHDNDIGLSVNFRRWSLFPIVTVSQRCTRTLRLRCQDTVGPHASCVLPVLA